MKKLFLLFAFSAIIFFPGCKFTTTDAFVPELKTNDKTLQQELGVFLVWEHINYNGYEKTANGASSKELVVEVINGRNIPEDSDELETIAKRIANVFKSNLKSPSVFKTWSVSFVEKQEDAFTSSSQSRSLSFTPDEL